MMVLIIECMENKKWMQKKCAINSLDYLISKIDNKWVEEKVKIKKKIKKEINEAFDFAMKSELPTKQDSWRHIYA